MTCHSRGHPVEFFLYGHDAGTWSKGIVSDEYGVPPDACPHYIGGVERPTQHMCVRTNCEDLWYLTC